jgi:hypothetical protein
MSDYATVEEPLSVRCDNQCGWTGIVLCAICIASDSGMWAETLLDGTALCRRHAYEALTYKDGGEPE